MIRTEDLPSVNAALNSSSALLLLAGYAAIRYRRVRVHQVFMLSALIVSLLFLASYVYYHIQAGHKEFYGTGSIRAVYLVVLLSHTLLAAVVAPLAVYTAYQGLTGRLARHRRVARWTLPIWLYVSITGVAVYVMLYRLYPAP